MKFPIHTKKGPRYVTVNALDTGTILGSDWRSAEKEARFVENWGKAGRWTNRDIEAQRRHAELEAGHPGAGSGVEKQHDRYAARDFEKEAQEAEELARQERMFMPDVNSMSKKEFERYLDQVRNGRQGYLGTKLEALKESTRGAREVAASGDRNTLIGLATRGLTSSGDPAHFQATLAHQEMTSDINDNDPQQTQTPRIQSNPHMMYGLTYSTPSSSSSTSPVTGRVVSRNQAHQDRYGGYNNNNSVRRNNNDDNKPWVVSVGGLTANLSNVNASVRDGGQRVKPVDYTRSKPDQGIYKFKIDKAELESPPKVHHLQQANKAARWSGRYKSVSGANQPSPLDTFEFDIVLSNATPAQDQDDPTTSTSTSSSSSPVPGSKEWVARDPTSGGSSRTMSPGDRLGASIGLGSSRKDRVGGQTLGYLDRLRGQAEEQKEADEKHRLYSEQNNDVARQLVQKLNLRNRGGSA